MDDLISRQAAIDALKHNHDVYSHNFHDDPIDKYTSAIITADIDSLVNLPSAQPEQRWIPCSERLPEEDACYLVTTSGTNNDIIDIAYYTEGIWHKASRIKAWMPLPEPYKEGKQDD